MRGGFFLFELVQQILNRYICSIPAAPQKMILISDLVSKLRVICLKYCTISNCSSRGVTRDRLDEFAPPARCIVMWDKSQILASPIFFLVPSHRDIYLSAQAIGHFVCDPRQMTDFIHIHWPCDAWWTNNSKWYSRTIVWRYKRNVKHILRWVFQDGTYLYR